MTGPHGEPYLALLNYPTHFGVIIMKTYQEVTIEEIKTLPSPSGCKQLQKLFMTCSFEINGERCFANICRIQTQNMGHQLLNQK